MSTEHTCQTCGKPLEQAGTGRPRRYCSRRCKRKAARQRASFGPFRRRESPVTAPVSAPSAEPAVPTPVPQASRLARAKELAHALARMETAEHELTAAQAARAALEPEEREWRVCETFTCEQWLQRNRGGIPAGPDTAEVAQHIRRHYEGNRRSAE